MPENYKKKGQVLYQQVYSASFKVSQSLAWLIVEYHIARVYSEQMVTTSGRTSGVPEGLALFSALRCKVMNTTILCK